MKKSIQAKVITDQELFFNLAAQKGQVSSPFSNFMMDYINKEQYDCFAWIADKKILLDYGCGNGESIDIFFQRHDQKQYEIYGVDIAEVAVKNAKHKYPKYHFYSIKNNSIPQMPDGHMDGAYMIHVLHHAQNHQKIFNTINSKLKKGGKFFLNDLTSQSPFIRLGRRLFTLLPRRVQERFSDDLFVDGSIPDKYVISVPLIVKQLRTAGFHNIEVSYGHLFFFLFCWIERFIPFSKFAVFRSIYTVIINGERYLLTVPFLQKYAEVVVIRCEK